MSGFPPHPITEFFAFIQKKQSILLMAPLSSSQPPRQQGRYSSWVLKGSGDHWSSDVHFSDLQLSETSAGYGIYIQTIFYFL